MSFLVPGSFHKRDFNCVAMPKGGIIVCAQGPIWSDSGLLSETPSNFDGGLYYDGSTIIIGFVRANLSPGFLISSDNGASWSSSNAYALFGGNYPKGIIKSGSYYVCNVGSTFLRSLDGLTWTAGAAGNLRYKLSINNVILAWDGSSSSIIRRSVDNGASFTSIAMPVTDYFAAFATDGSRVVLPCRNNVLYSDDLGLSWSVGTKSALWDTGNDKLCLYGSGVFVCVNSSGISGKTAYSYDGITWFDGGLQWLAASYSIGYGNGAFLCAGASNSVSMTIDGGKTWFVSPNKITPSGARFYIAGNGKGKWVNYLQPETIARIGTCP